jgi:hypothetical protein
MLSLKPTAGLGTRHVHALCVTCDLPHGAVLVRGVRLRCGTRRVRCRAHGALGRERGLRRREFGTQPSR